MAGTNTGQLAEDAAHPPHSELNATIEIALADFASGQVSEALNRLRQIAQDNPESYWPAFLLGTLFARLGQHGEAAAHFHKALSLNSAHVESLKGFALALVELGRFTEAESPARALLQQAPEDAIAHVLFSYVCAATDRFEEAIASAEEALRLNPTEVAALLQLAQALILLDRDEDAIAVLTRAKGLEPDNLITNLRLARALKSAGHLNHAREQLEEILIAHPERGEVYYELSEIEKFESQDERIAAMETALLSGPAPNDAYQLHFALGKAYDDCCDYDKAFSHFAAANALERSAVPYDEPATLNRIDRTIEIFSPSLLRRLEGAGDQSDAPIFIIGMPRSGTTLVEQIIASHSEVSAGGEIDIFMPALRDVVARSTTPGLAADLARLTAADVTALGSEYVARVQRLRHGRPHLTDKQLNNRLFIGLIHAALPNAKIIHCQRDPLDTCLSSYMKPFGGGVGYANDLSSLGRYYRRYEVMMAHWCHVLPPERMLEVRYEDIVDDVEGEARRIIAHCGLEWQPQCLEYYRIKRPIRTASVAQVCQPIYRTSLGRWRPYEAHLAPLISALNGSA